jgi:hypothetical protein
MSELKELSWSVPETVRPVPFEQLERRGVRRRRRRQVAAGAGVAAVAAVVVLAVVLPLGDRPNSLTPPIAAAWGCPAKPCDYTAVLMRDGVRATAMVSWAEYTTVRVGDEAMAVTRLRGDRFSSADPNWTVATLARLTAEGRKETALPYAKPTKRESIEKIVMSVDRGESWKTVQSTLWSVRPGRSPSTTAGH